MKRNVQNTSKGITLVALVITIIVLLILAGVAINMAINSDGLFGKANEAADKWNTAVKDESDTIDNLLEELGVINWEKAKAEAVAPASQTKTAKTTIGIDTNGEVVNMDLWKFNKDEITGGYGLQDTIAFTTKSSSDIEALEGEIKAGYQSTDFIDVRIPQYITTDNGETWTAVTNLDWTFYNCIGLTQISNIPETVVSMRYTFKDCSNLITGPNIPDSVLNMYATFEKCTSLKIAPKLGKNVENMRSAFLSCSSLESVSNIPSSVTNMTYTFYKCESLAKVPNIPDSVTEMYATFQECSNLKVAPKIGSKVEDMTYTFYSCYNLTSVGVIPASVKKLYGTFYGCLSLTGTLEINATNLENYNSVLGNAVKNEGCKLKLTGTCPLLEEIVTSTNNVNIT